MPATTNATFVRFPALSVSLTAKPLRVAYPPPRAPKHKRRHLPPRFVYRGATGQRTRVYPLPPPPTPEELGIDIVSCEGM